MATLGLGVIGCGNMGASLAKGAQVLDCAQVVCVSDVEAEKGQALAKDLGSDFDPDYPTKWVIPLSPAPKKKITVSHPKDRPNLKSRRICESVPA